MEGWQNAWGHIPRIGEGTGCLNRVHTLIETPPKRLRPLGGSSSIRLAVFAGFNRKRAASGLDRRRDPSRRL
ncbi:MAG: hypothetical protein LBD58_13405 [Treponema sp.]|nr:hypothetical protein [Treponema sp.]